MATAEYGGKTGYGMDGTESAADRKEIYTYEAPWPIYSMSWSVRQDQKYRIAVGSFLEEYRNKVRIIQLNSEQGGFELKGEFEHPYPATKVVWAPGKTRTEHDIVATSGDYLRLWTVDDQGSNVKIKALLNNNKNSEFCAPLTSFDWNEVEPELIGTASIDTTCTIWNIETGQVKTQLIAHDKEVYDIAWAPSTDVFASCGADGSVRMFDLRTLDHSTIIYEAQDLVPILRLAWNKQDQYYLSCFCRDERRVVILDIRHPSLPVAELAGHHKAVNAIAWAPHSSCHICSVSDDAQALIWDLSNMPKPIDEPILAYTPQESQGSSQAQIHALAWGAHHPDWVGIGFNNKCQILRV